ncbi:hypothetical protein IP86_17245 [Rhodopseudomonas sp. AAP120]|uniref:hypothetical protein n=1 Tax=Rhodopseudomonas TaxID=1073 RepID=UPI0001779624|nr:MULTISPECIES: hypothetical protein [Rhodopseudomonas]ACE99615.1 putative exported protein of unknown function [Rhodopseudomonas palustris TIE-1]KPF96173.1 hypothetical protein IP86_17245 [Rhodopseudomonas sp. AAP120]
MSKRNASIALCFAFAVSAMAAPAVAQSAAEMDQNAHHYQGGPKTVVPHAMKHPDFGQEATRGDVVNTGHHYSGGPKEGAPHHMGEKK